MSASGVDSDISFQSLFQIGVDKLEKRDASPIQGVSRAGMKAMRKGIAAGTGATGEAEDERHCQAHVARREGDAKGERTGRGWKCRATYLGQHAKEKKMSLNTFPPGWDE